MSRTESSDVVSCCNLVGALPLHILVSYLNVPEISPHNPYFTYPWISLGYHQLLLLQGATNGVTQTPPVKGRWLLASLVNCCWATNAAEWYCRVTDNTVFIGAESSLTGGREGGRTTFPTLPLSPDGFLCYWATLSLRPPTVFSRNV